MELSADISPVLLTFALSVTVLALIRQYVLKKWQFLKNLNIPHDEPSIWKLGNFLDALSPKSAFEYDNRNKVKYGNIWGLYTFTSPSITIHDPAILRQIFVNQFQNFTERQGNLTKISGRELNSALSFATGRHWKRLRTTLSPTFSSAKLKLMVPVIDWCADNAIEACRRIVLNGNGTFNSKGFFSRLSLDIICSTAFSANVNSQDVSKPEPEICKQAKLLFSGNFTSPLFILCFMFPCVEKLIGKLGIPIFGEGSLKYFKDLTEMIIKRRSEKSAKQHQRVDLMQLMIDSEISDKTMETGVSKGLTRTEIIGNSLIMIIAGYENTGNSLSFLAYNLAQHPEIQEKAQAEIDNLIKEKGTFDYDGIQKLKYLEMCIFETLRIYNPIIRNARVCNEETVINGLRIPKGVQINIPTFGLSHDPEHWDQPYEFNPERMRDMSQIDPMVYQPFGAGPRNCIGMRFALLEMKLAIAKILRQYSFGLAEFTPKPPLQMRFAVSTRPAIDYDLRLIPRCI